MFLVLIVVGVVVAVNREKILARVMKKLMAGKHRLEYSKREAYKYLYDHNLL